MRFSDPLYYVFEQHLFTALVEDESTDAFLERVVVDYVGRLVQTGAVIPQAVRATLDADLREEVLEMLRKKTYGHFNLSSYRIAHGIEAPVKEKARRNGRAC